MVRYFIPATGFTYENYEELKIVIEGFSAIQENLVILFSKKIGRTECDAIIFSEDSIHYIEAKRHTFTKGSPDGPWYFQGKNKILLYEKYWSGSLENPFQQAIRIAHSTERWLKQKAKYIFTGTISKIPRLRVYPWVISSKSSKGIKNDVYCVFTGGINSKMWKRNKKIWSDDRCPCKGIKTNFSSLESFFKQQGCEEITLDELRALKTRKEFRSKEWKISDIDLLKDLPAILSSLNIDHYFSDFDLLPLRENEVERICDLLKDNNVVVTLGRTGTGKSTLMSQISHKWIERGGYVSLFPMSGFENEIETFPSDLLLLIDNFAVFP